MSFSLTINDTVVSVTAPIQVTLLRQSPGTLTTTVRSSAWAVETGQSIGAYFGATRFFGGTVHEIRQKRLGGPGSDEYSQEITCVSWEFDLGTSRPVRAKYFNDMNAGEVVTDLMGEFAAEFDLVQVDDGAPADKLKNLVFIGKTLAECLDYLADISSCLWFVDPSKGFHFVSLSTIVVASVDVNSTNVNYRNPMRTLMRSEYYNSVTISISHDAFPANEETYTGDGTTREFTLIDGPFDAIVETVESVELNGLANTVGVKDVDVDADWWYTPGSAILEQNPANPVLTPSDSIVVKYRRFNGNQITVTDDDEVTARAALEGGNGYYHAYIEDTELKDQDRAIAKANAFLDKHAPGRVGGVAGSVPMQVDWETLSLWTGFEEMVPGRKISVQFSNPWPEEDPLDVLINTVELETMAGTENMIVRVSGSPWVPIQDPFEMYRAFAEIGQQSSGVVVTSGGTDVEGQPSYV